MTRWAACALVAGVAALACAPVLAQHGSVGGGGHAAAAPAAHSAGFSGAARTSSLGAPRFVSSPGQIATSAVAPARAGANRPGVYGAYGNYGNSRRTYQNRNGVYGYYPVAIYPGYADWSSSDFLSYPDTPGDDAPQVEAEAGPPPQEQMMAPEPGAYAAPEAAPGPYVSRRPQPAPAPVAAAPLPEEDAVTIVFKDGRPSEQIHNYALTRTTLYVPGRRIREIPLEQVDLAATAKVNHDAGVAFQLPQGQ